MHTVTRKTSKSPIEQCIKTDAFTPPNESFHGLFFQTKVKSNLKQRKLALIACIATRSTPVSLTELLAINDRIPSITTPPPMCEKKLEAENARWKKLSENRIVRTASLGFFDPSLETNEQQPPVRHSVSCDSFVAGPNT